jgi:hypothetical protein
MNIDKLTDELVTVIDKIEGVEKAVQYTDNTLSIETSSGSIFVVKIEQIRRGV